MRFVHTADWHLGKRLSGFVLADQQREALQSLLSVVDKERVDGVIVAGDVFDTPIPPLSALDTWDWFVGELVVNRGIPLLAIPGNHDHPERLGVNGRVSRRAGLYILNELEQVHVPVELGGVRFFGVPFHKPAHVRLALGLEGELSDADFDGAMRRVLEHVRAARADGMPTVLVGHAFVEGGGEEPEGEDAIQVGGAGAVSAGTLGGFDYVALGHIHGGRSLADDGLVRYSGSIYPYSFGEAGREKTVDLVEVDGVAVKVEQAPLDASRKVRVIDGKSFNQVIDEAESVSELDRLDYVLVRVADRGPIDNALARLREVYPHSLLQQPEIEVEAAAVRFEGDARTIPVEDAFRKFYEYVYEEDLGGLEEEIFREVLQAGDEEVEEGPA